MTLIDLGLVITGIIVLITSGILSFSIGYKLGQWLTRKFLK